MKKLLLTLGASAAAIAPVMTLVACGKEEVKAADAFKLGEGKFETDTLKFEITANEDEVKKFKAEDVTTALKAITDALAKNIVAESDTTTLAGTKLSFDKTIDFDSEGTEGNKGSVGKTEAKFATNTIDASYTSIASIKTALGTNEAETKAKLMKAVSKNLYGSASDTDNLGFKLLAFNAADLSETVLTFNIKTDQILLDLFAAGQTSEFIIGQLANSVKATLAGTVTDFGTATTIKFKVNFKDESSKVVVSSKDSEIKISEISTTATEQTDTITKLNAKLIAGDSDASTIAGQVVEAIKTALTA